MGHGNKYTGEVPLKINGKQYTLIFDMGAIAFIQTECGQEALDEFMQLKDARKIAFMIIGGLQRLHKDELTVDDILKSDLGLVPAKAAIDMGITFAYFGAEGAEAIMKELQAESPQVSAKKKPNPPRKKTK